MSNWIAITVDTLNEAKIAPLITAASSAAKAVGQVDRAAGLIQGVVNEIRRKVGSCSANQLDSDTTKIPASLRDMAVDMIIARLKFALNRDPSPGELEQLRRHATNLDRIAEGKDAVEEPDDPIAAPVQGGGSVEIVTPPTRDVTRTTMGGL